MPIKSRTQRIIFFIALALVWLLCSGVARATPLQDRLDQFPNWERKPAVQPAEGNLIYPDWFEGTWTVTTTLEDLAAPLAPDLVTPGFQSNKAYLQQPIEFRARFKELITVSLTDPSSIWNLVKARNPGNDNALPIVADRAFNGFNLAVAYLTDNVVQSVKVDSNNPNFQFTQLQGDRQLSSTITGRVTEAPDEETYLTTEIVQQEFRSPDQFYLNEVETTTEYHFHPQEPTPITAEQVTAIYLSPQDPEYFSAGSHPVALYRYHMDFKPITD